MYEKKFLYMFWIDVSGSCKVRRIYKDGVLTKKGTSVIVLIPIARRDFISRDRNESVFIHDHQP